MNIANKDNVTKYSDVNRTLTRVEMDQNFQEVKNVIADVKAIESNFENRLGNVDNTSDMDKPVSIAQGQAIQSVRNEVTKLRTDLAAADENYGAGVVIERRNQTFWKDGIPYRPNASLELPYTTTGDWGDEEGLFVSVGGDEVTELATSFALMQKQIVDADWVIPSGYNALVIGDLNVNPGVTVTGVGSATLRGI